MTSYDYVMLVGKRLQIYNTLFDFSFHFVIFFWSPLNIWEFLFLYFKREREHPEGEEIIVAGSMLSAEPDMWLDLLLSSGP